jgi:hypothetical protein
MKILLLFLNLILLSCNGGRASGGGDSSSKTTIFEGTFVSNCIQTGSHYEKTTIENTGSSSVQTLSHYNGDANGNCSQTSMYAEIKKTYSFTVGSDYTSLVIPQASVTKAYKINYQLQKITLAVYNNGIMNEVDNVNNGLLGADCLTVNPDPWTDGVAIDVTGIQCSLDSSLNPSAGTLIYSFMDLNSSTSPIIITPGDLTADASYDGHSEASRVIDLGTSLTKQ